MLKDMLPKTVAFVPARVSSQRLPRKHYELIGELSILEWVHKRIEDSRYIDEVLLCVPDEPGAEDLLTYGCGIGFSPFLYHGRIDDVVGRLAAAAQFAKAELCVLVSGDCPLLCTELMDQLIEAHYRAYVEGKAPTGAYFKPREGFRHGLEGCKVATRGIWQLADLLSNSKFERENQFPIIDTGYQRSYELPLQYEEVAGDDSDYQPESVKFSVDTPEDLKLHRQIQQNGFYKYKSLKESNFEVFKDRCYNSDQKENSGTPNKASEKISKPRNGATL